jgi:general secretion pathway protein F
VAAFEYTAVDASGRERTGVIEGDTPRHVRQILREQQLLPVQVVEVEKREARRNTGRFALRRGISATDLAMLTRQLATLTRAGLPLEEALLAVSQQTEKPRVQSIVAGVRARVMEGRSLADGLAAFPQAFPEIYVATVAAGEQSGRLDAVLERLADYTENRQILQSRVRNALVYPVLLSIVCVIIVSLLLGYVVPEVVNVFRAGKQELPLLTRVLIGISDGFRAWWWLIFGVTGFGIWAFKRRLRDPAALRNWHRFLLGVPLWGRVLRGVDAARFARTLSILTASAVPVLEALRIAGSVVGNVPMREAVAEAAVRVREGAPIARSLGTSKLYPPMLIHLIASGETSGELESMLDRAATNQEREMDGIVNTAVNILGPAMILVMGGFVLLIVLALLLPIFQLNTLVR